MSDRATQRPPRPPALLHTSAAWCLPLANCQGRSAIDQRCCATARRWAAGAQPPLPPPCRWRTAAGHAGFPAASRPRGPLHNTTPHPTHTCLFPARLPAAVALFAVAVAAKDAKEDSKQVGSCCLCRAAELLLQLASLHSACDFHGQSEFGLHEHSLTMQPFHVSA